MTPLPRPIPPLRLFVRLSEEYVIPLNRGTVTYECSSSIGVATYDSTSNREAVLRHADHSMYEDKRARTNPISLELKGSLQAQAEQ